MSGKKMEGSEEQRRAAAREARDAGKSASEVGATQGSSKQQTRAGDDMTHQQKLDLKREGKHGGGTEDAPEARPGSRDADTPDQERFPRM